MVDIMISMYIINHGQNLRGEITMTHKEFLNKMQNDMETLKAKADTIKRNMVNHFDIAIAKIETYQIKTGRR